MNNSKYFRFLLLFPLLLCMQTGSVFAGYVEDIASLYDSGKAKAAHTLALKNLMDGEGDPGFDLYYGMSAIDSGFVSEGIFALERLRLTQPNNLRGRLELGRGYFILELYGRACREFNAVLETDLPPKVTANVERFLGLIRQRLNPGQVSSRSRVTSRKKPSHGFYAEAGLGYDTNINSGAPHAGFDYPFWGSGILDDDAVAQEDSSFSLGAGVFGNYTVKPGVLAFGKIDASIHDNFSSSDFDTGSVNLEGGVQYQKGKDNFRGSLQRQFYNVGHHRYRDLTGINGLWRRKLDKNSQINLFLQVADMEYPGNHIKDSLQVIGGAGFVRALPGDWKPMIFGSAYFGRERAEEDDPDAEALVNRSIRGMRIGTQVTLQPKVSAYLSAQLQHSDYKNVDFVFAKERDDLFGSISLGATWKPVKHWSVRGKLSVTENSSNIEINEYRRTEAGVTVRYDY